MRGEAVAAWAIRRGQARRRMARLLAVGKTALAFTGDGGMGWCVWVPEVRMVQVMTVGGGIA